MEIGCKEELLRCKRFQFQAPRKFLAQVHSVSQFISRRIAGRVGTGAHRPSICCVALAELEAS